MLSAVADAPPDAPPRRQPGPACVSTSDHAKIVRDVCVPGDYAKLSPVAVSIIDTPVFQRLRGIKQLGATEYVFPGATHTRFSHALGTAHRARELVAWLAQQQPELGVTASDLQVAEVAGLCHDLGHGPFSHAFEAELVPFLFPEVTDKSQLWHHEAQSCRMFAHIAATFHVGLTWEECRRVQDMILGEPRLACWDGKEWMLQVVANKLNGIDVDKLDYLKRDNMAVGELTTSEFSPLWQNVRVLHGRICFKASVRSAVADVYAARARMHEYVYTHVVCKGVELQIMDALKAAAEELRLRESLCNPDLFALLDDSILREIERSRSQSASMCHARTLLEKLRHRDMYKFVAGADVPQDKLATFPKVKPEDVLAFQDVTAAGVELQPADIRVVNHKIDFTLNDENPMKHVYFYQSSRDTEPFVFDHIPFLPANFLTRQVHVYLARLDDNPAEKRRCATALQLAFERWSLAVLQARQVLSPQKSTLTASARKRSRVAERASHDEEQQHWQQQQQQDVRLSQAAQAIHDASDAQQSWEQQQRGREEQQHEGKLSQPEVDSSGVREGTGSRQGTTPGSAAQRQLQMERS